MKLNAKLGVLGAFDDITAVPTAILLENQFTIEILGHFVSDSIFGNFVTHVENVVIVNTNGGLIFSFFVLVFGSIGDVPI